jgi:hypothetical protein
VIRLAGGGTGAATSITPVPGARATKRTLVGAATALLLMGLSGCGHTASVGANRTLRVALTEYGLLPQKVRASAGELTIIVHNVGKLAHNLEVLQGSQKIDGTPPIWPGTVRELTVELTPGSYTLASTLFSDRDLGEYGTLTVTS